MTTLEKIVCKTVEATNVENRLVDNFLLKVPYFAVMKCICSLRHQSIIQKCFKLWM